MIMREMYQDMVNPALSRKHRTVAGFYLLVSSIVAVFVVYCFTHALMLNISIYGVVLGAIVPIIVTVALWMLVKRIFR